MALEVTKMLVKTLAILSATPTQNLQYDEKSQSHNGSHKRDLVSKVVNKSISDKLLKDLFTNWKKVNKVVTATTGEH